MLIVCTWLLLQLKFVLQPNLILQFSLLHVGNHSSTKTNAQCGQVGVEYNAGFTVAVAGVLESKTAWSLCLQRNGIAMWS